LVFDLFFAAAAIYFIAIARPQLAAICAVMGGVLIGGLLSLRDTPMTKTVFPQRDEDNGQTGGLHDHH
jgi:hypothetical protein